MLRYTEIGLSRMEIPGETLLCVYVEGYATDAQGVTNPLFPEGG